MNFPIDHPIWLIGKALILFIAAYFLSKVNASDFDETELWFLAQLATVLFGGTLLGAFIRKKHP
jgi:hypothetical protein